MSDLRNPYVNKPKSSLDWRSFRPPPAPPRRSLLERFIRAFLG